MKNIHLLPTDKPSRLLFDKEDNRYLPLQDEPIFMEHQDLVENQHIYITSDEKAKEGDWVIQVNSEKTNTQIIHCITEFQVKLANDKDGSFTKKKIILTTDGDLIKDGVQPIDDEFLEWFVKNPSCESVDVNYELGSCLNCEWNHDMCPNSEECLKNKYNIIIPKEQTNGERFDEFMRTVEGYPHLAPYLAYPELEGTMNLCHDITERRTGKMTEEEWQSAEISKTGTKGETLEVAAEKEAEARYPVLIYVNPKDSPYVESKETFKHGVRFGAKWQAERIENESEQLINELESLVKDNSLGESYRAGITASIWRMKEWFEQFKKK